MQGYLLLNNTLGWFERMSESLSGPKVSSSEYYNVASIFLYGIITDINAVLNMFKVL